LATRIIVRALDAAGIPAGWVAGDEVYGNDAGLRATLEQRGVGYVLAVGSAARITTAAGIYRVDQRWTVEQSFQTSKGQTGSDEHQVRTWRSWHRWTTLVLVAHLFLAIATATARTVPAPAGLIPLTLNEFRHLFAALVITPALPLRQVGLFSYWRRRHQCRAQESHYQRQADREP
jgi:hypothetical protein